MHYGLVPRANRGIFAINELPDLAGKIQVGLFNILQEGDVQIKGYPIRLPLDVLMVFSANPEDYTARGKIITPLKDRIGSEIRTHYPATRSARDGDHRAGSLAASAATSSCPEFVREAVEEVAFQARARSEDRQALGRQPAAARSRCSRTSSRTPSGARCSPARPPIVPRITDIYAALPAITGKFELEYEGELRGADNVARDIIRGAVGNVFNGYFANADLRQVTEWFDLGGNLQVDDTLAADGAARRAPATCRACASSPSRPASSATRRRRRWSRRRSTSCSKASTRRRRSAARTSSSTSRPSRRAARARAALQTEPMIEREMPNVGGKKKYYN